MAQAQPRSMSPSRSEPLSVQTSAKSAPGIKAQRESIEDFEIIEQVGEGHLSAVLHCVDVRSGIHVAVKSYHKDRMNLISSRQVAREIELQASLQHPSIVQIYAAFEDKEGIYVVQEFALGGDLYAQLAQAGGYLAEDQVAGEVMVPVLAALGHMHDKGIMHRDIKPENLLLSEKYEVKLADFGLAINTDAQAPISRVGTLDYMAPEIVRISTSLAGGAPRDAPAGSGAKANYGKAADVWAVGILTYELLIGGPAFEADTKEGTFKLIESGEPFHPRHLSESSKDFMRKCLVKEEKKRATVAELQQHPWVTRFASQVAPAMFEEEEQEQEVSPLKAALEEAVSAAEAQGRSKQPGARRNSHKPNEVIELQQFQGKIMAGGVPGSLASKCAGGAWSGALEGGGGTPRNTAAADDGSDSDLLRAVRMQQESKSDVNGNLLQSFRNMDVTTGPAGTPRFTANTGV
ncbi:TPA: hypothetical protein ACH3X3_010855 [Trebouxia sp. C0006]